MVPNLQLRLAMLCDALSDAMHMGLARIRLQPIAASLRRKTSILFQIKQNDIGCQIITFLMKIMDFGWICFLFFDQNPKPQFGVKKTKPCIHCSRLLALMLPAATCFTALAYLCFGSNMYRARSRAPRARVRPEHAGPAGARRAGGHHLRPGAARAAGLGPAPGDPVMGHWNGHHTNIYATVTGMRHVLSSQRGVPARVAWGASGCGAGLRGDANGACSGWDGLLRF